MAHGPVPVRGKPGARSGTGTSPTPVALSPRSTDASSSGSTKPFPGQGAVSTLTGGVDEHTPEGNLTINVRALQSMLKKQGYDINVDGKLGPQTLAALRDWYGPKDAHNLSPALDHALVRTGPLKGTRDPNAFNARFGDHPQAPYRPPVGKGGTLDKNGNDISGQYAPPSQDVDLSDPQAQAKAIANTTPIPQTLANFGTLINPNTADSMAGEQYDPQIREAQLMLARDPLLQKQHAADINSYYGQVIGSQKTAASRDHAAYDAATGSLTDAGKALVASLGGGANAGAGLVGAASADAAGTSAAMQQAEDQYNNDLAPLLQNEKAGMVLNQGNADEAQQRSDQVALENLQGQRGQAKNNALAQIQQENNALQQARAGMGLDIRNANNALVQQGFNNSLALAQAAIAAQMDGLKVAGLASKANAANLKATNPFLALSPEQKNGVFQYAMGRLYDPTTGQKLNLTPQQATSRVNAALASYGFNPTPGTPSGAFGANIVRTWQTS